jgi:hypothetical protein
MPPPEHRGQKPGEFCVQPQRLHFHTVWMSMPPIPLIPWPLIPEKPLIPEIPEIPVP